jgi:hypothetical protein
VIGSAMPRMPGTIRGSLFTAVRFSAIHAMTLATSDSVIISSAAEEVDGEAERPARLDVLDTNGPRRHLRGPFRLVAGTGFEPATSGL